MSKASSSAVSVSHAAFLSGFRRCLSLVQPRIACHPPGAITEQGDVSVSIFFHGQKFQEIRLSSYSWKAVWIQSLLFSPPSPM